MFSMIAAMSASRRREPASAGVSSGVSIEVALGVSVMGLRFNARAPDPHVKSWMYTLIPLPHVRGRGQVRGRRVRDDEMAEPATD